MYKPEYKTGDRVVIKPWALMEERYGLDSTGSIEVKATFTEKMEECLKGTDRVVTLGGRFLCGSFDGTGHLKGFEVSPDAILGYAFEYGEEIEVSDTGAEWHPWLFSSYDPANLNLLVRATEVSCSNSSAGWKYARPVQVKIIVKFFNENNEDITESISEETKRKLLIDN